MAEITPVAPIVTEVPKPSFWPWVLGLLLVVVSMTAAFLAWENQRLRQQLIKSTINPTVSVSPLPVALPCPVNFKLYQNRVFSVCQPAGMTVTEEEYPAHDRPEVQAVRTTFEDSLQKIVIMTVFTGGWGGGYDVEKTSLGNLAATKLTAKDSSNQLANLVIVTDQNQTGQFPIAIDYQRKSETITLDEALFNQLISSFQLKWLLTPGY